MKTVFIRALAVCVAALTLTAAASAAPEGGRADARLRVVTYDPQAVVAVPVQRGTVTLIVLDPDEAITEVAAGLGGDCNKPDAAWCVAAQPGGRHVFVKAKSQARAANTLAVVTTRRAHAFRLEVLGEGDARAPVYRLLVRAPSAASTPQRVGPASARDGMAQARPVPAPPWPPMPALPVPPTVQEILAERMQARPQVVNTNYSLAEGNASQDIVPTLVFDDGRFTYLRFPGNREVPAVFHVLGDGSETLVNARMEDDLLVVDRVSRRLMLRAGSAVVGIWNEAFDLDGVALSGGTTVPGVQRVIRPDTEAPRSPGAPTDAENTP